MMLGHGETTLVAGAKTIAHAKIPADAVIVLSRKSALGTIGDLWWTITPDTSFSINSLSVLDLSVVHWAVFV